MANLKTIKWTKHLDEQKITGLKPGNALRLYLKQAGGLKKDIAKRWGISPGYLSDLSNPHTHASWQAMMMLAKGMEIPIEMLVLMSMDFPAEVKGNIWAAVAKWEELQKQEAGAK